MCEFLYVDDMAQASLFVLDDQAYKTNASADAVTYKCWCWKRYNY